MVLQTCLDVQKKTKQPKNQSDVLCKLGNHQWSRSIQLKNEGKTKEADEMWKTAVKVRLSVFFIFGVGFMEIKRGNSQTR